MDIYLHFGEKMFIIKNAEGPVMDYYKWSQVAYTRRF